jgi:hypothetical protein
MAYNERFGAMSALPRRQFCAKLHVTTPQEVQWKPPPHKAAGTLEAMQESAVQFGNKKRQRNKRLKYRRIDKLEKIVRMVQRYFIDSWLFSEIQWTI